MNSQWVKYVFPLLLISACGGIIWQRRGQQQELSQLIGARLLVAEKVAYPMALPQITDMQGRIWQPGGDKPILLHFWATWCPSCLKELSSISALYSTNRDQLQIITVSVDEDNAALDRFLRENRFQLPLFRAPGAQSDLPRSYLLNKNGQVCYRFDGTKPWAAPHVQARLDQLIKELP